ncbi:hypothetical protein ACFL51_00800 [Myxococcota bacterium]
MLSSTRSRRSTVSFRAAGRGTLRPGSLALVLSSMLVLAGLAACGGDSVGNAGDTVGGPCDSAGDCDERCLTSGDFPAGTCAVSCASDDDCPDDTVCIDKEGGVCLLACEVTTDCRDGYHCDDEDNLGRTGESLVCTGD